MLKRKPWAVLLVATAGIIGGCGSSTHYANDPRPPLLLNVTSAISHGHVLISPSLLGAGPVALIVANLTNISQQLSITRPAPHALDLESGPLNPGDTATLQIDLYPGVYTAKTDDPSIVGERIVVGATRPSSSDQLQLP